MGHFDGDHGRHDFEHFIACVAIKGKGKGVLRKGVLGARETRGAREEGGRETPARKPLFFSFILTSTRRMLKS